ncbi:DUF1062 domain-containing protein [Phyllobacterium sp. 22229]|uniref:DUF1062 domain-containing protein n=1 Tax=Phyllobacterium sp. 22229 TaxID=3453895 RepID=UPI003F868501
MSNILSVQWTIVPRTAPQPLIACSHCRCVRPFKSSGKARLNANGRKLDAWLIYKCTVCDNTWNRTIFERRHVRDIDPQTLSALQSNDPEWLEELAFNLTELQQKTKDGTEFSDVFVAKKLLSQASDVTHLSIELRLPLTTTVRLDRLLASELALSRSRIQTLERDGLLSTAPSGRNILRKSIGDGLAVLMDISNEPERSRIMDAASRQVNS